MQIIFQGPLMPQLLVLLATNAKKNKKTLPHLEKQQKQSKISTLIRKKDFKYKEALL